MNKSQNRPKSGIGFSHKSKQSSIGGNSNFGKVLTGINQPFSAREENAIFRNSFPKTTTAQQLKSNIY